MSGDGFSLHAFVRAVRDSKLDPEQSLVAYTVATYTNSDDCTTWVGTETLAKATRLSETTVRKVLQSLEAGGVLVRVVGEGGGRTMRRLDTAAVAAATPREKLGRKVGTPARGTGVDDAPTPARGEGDPRTGHGGDLEALPPHGAPGTPARGTGDPRTGHTRSDLTSVFGSDQNTPLPPAGGEAAGEEPTAPGGLPEEGEPRAEHAALEMMLLTQPGTERSPLFEPPAAEAVEDPIAAAERWGIRVPAEPPPGFMTDLDTYPMPTDRDPRHFALRATRKAYWERERSKPPAPLPPPAPPAPEPVSPARAAADRALTTARILAAELESGEPVFQHGEADRRAVERALDEGHTEEWLCGLPLYAWTQQDVFVAKFRTLLGPKFARLRSEYDRHLFEMRRQRAMYGDRPPAGSTRRSPPGDPA